jgi:hypothetical protein
MAPLRRGFVVSARSLGRVHSRIAAAMPSVTQIEFMCGCGEIGVLHVGRLGDRERYVPDNGLIGTEVELSGHPSLADVIAAVAPKCSKCQAPFAVRHIHAVRGLPKGSVPAARPRET